MTHKGTRCQTLLPRKASGSAAAIRGQGSAAAILLPAQELTQPVGQPREATPHAVCVCAQSPRMCVGMRLRTSCARRSSRPESPHGRCRNIRSASRARSADSEIWPTPFQPPVSGLGDSAFALSTTRFRTRTQPLSRPAARPARASAAPHACARALAARACRVTYIMDSVTRAPGCDALALARSAQRAARSAQRAARRALRV